MVVTTSVETVWTSVCNVSVVIDECAETCDVDSADARSSTLSFEDAIGFAVSAVALFRETGPPRSARTRSSISRRLSSR